MATNTPNPQTLLFFFLLITTPPPSNSFSFVQCQTLLSIFHSLMLRVANLRASRGDLSGSERAKLIAAKLELGLQLGAKLELGFWNVMWSMGWYYVKNYAWRDMSSAELFAAVSDAKELMRSLNELTQMRSDEDRVAWVKRNYQNLLRVSNSIFRRLLRVFRQSGPMRAAVETVQKEVVEGGLLWDCLELGSNDLKGFVQIFKDVALQFSSTYMLTPVISEREREKRNEKISVHRILSIPFVQKQGKKQLEEKKK